MTIENSKNVVLYECFRRYYIWDMDTNTEFCAGLTLADARAEYNNYINNK